MKNTIKLRESQLKEMIDDVTNKFYGGNPTSYPSGEQWIGEDGELNKSDPNVFYNPPGTKGWYDDNDKYYNEDYFDFDYTEEEFDDFLSLDKKHGHEQSLFGTRGLPVGHPDRSSKSFDDYNKMSKEKYGHSLKVRARVK
jgi:hypothetical protein